MDADIIKSFQERVELNYQLYNSMFLTLPLEAVEEVGLLLPLFEESCQKGFKESKDPLIIINSFFQQHKPSLTESDQMKRSQPSCTLFVLHSTQIA